MWYVIWLLLAVFCASPAIVAGILLARLGNKNEIRA